PRARWVSFGLVGVDPTRMLHGNPQACDKALAKAGLTWDDIAVIEVNEAFASVVLQFAKDAGLTRRMEDVNPNGGGISLGHPLGRVVGADAIRAHSSTRRPTVQRGELAILYASVWQAIFGVAEVVGELEHDPSRDRWAWRFAIRPLVVVEDLDRAPAAEAAGI